MNTWIFQGNPEKFDIERYMNDRKKIWWSVRQRHFLDRINIGDIVYLWRSDGKEKGSGGILAKAKVIGPYAERKDSEAKEYWHNDDWKKPGIGIPLEVLEVRPTKGFVKRTELSRHHLLKNLNILRIRNLTNYLLTNEQAQELNKLWGNNSIFGPSDVISRFSPPPGAKELYKQVGTSQYTDGVRIDIDFHNIFNPPKSEFYTKRGTAREIKVLFNNKIFEAEYRFENQKDKSRELQSIRFRKELKQEFERVFPIPEGVFIIQQGQDLNHFVFTHLVDVIDIEDSENEYPEGRIEYKLHRIRERNKEVIKKAKESFSKKHKGRLFCEICGFDFLETYGDRGRDFIEGHHKKLVSEMKDGEKTKVEDIAMVCSNCHRMLHRKPILTIEEMARLIVG